MTDQWVEMTCNECGSKWTRAYEESSLEIHKRGCKMSSNAEIRQACEAVHPGITHEKADSDHYLGLTCNRVLALIEKVRQAKDREWLNAFSIECDYSAAEAAAMINEDRAACEDIERRKATADAYRRGMQEALEIALDAKPILLAGTPDLFGEQMRKRIAETILAKLAEKGETMEAYRKRDPNMFNHTYAGKRNEGYAVCESCGCREDSDAAAKPCRYPIIHKLAEKV